MKPTAGTFTLRGVDMTRDSIRERSKLGLSHIPKDRHKHGLVLDYSLEQNLVLENYWKQEFQNHGFIRFKAVRDYAERLIEQYDIRSGQGPVTVARSMSGGNQQRPSWPGRLTRTGAAGGGAAHPWIGRGSHRIYPSADCCPAGRGESGFTGHELDEALKGCRPHPRHAREIVAS